MHGISHLPPVIPCKEISSASLLAETGRALRYTLINCGFIP